MIARDAGHKPTEFKNIILSKPTITKIMVDSHCEIMWADNSEADLGHHPIANYVAVLDDTAKQAVTSQQHLRSRMICLWINYSLTTYAKRKVRDFDSG